MSHVGLGDLRTWARALRPKRPLYPYQLEALLAMEKAVGDALFRGILTELLFLWPRQAGKNEVDAVWCLRFLSWWGALCTQDRLRVGVLEAIRTAPTYKPGVAVSKRRLEVELERWQRMSGQLWKRSEGYCYSLDGLGSRIKFLSAGEQAARRGETANGYLSVDECQHTSADVADRELNPMRSTTGAPAFYFGTQWHAESLINLKLALLTAQEQTQGRKLVHRIPWWIVAEFNESYGLFVQAERERLGPNHPVYLGEYRLKVVGGTDTFLDADGYSKLMGKHQRGTGAKPQTIYVGGVDFCGADEQPDEAAFDVTRAQKLDNTCAWILELSFREERIKAPKPAPGQPPGEDIVSWLPVYKTVDVLYLPGQHPQTGVDRIEQFLFGKWKCANVHVDANGVGDSPSKLLLKRHPNQVVLYNASRPKNSVQGLLLKACIDTGRFSLWHAEVPDENLRLARQQFKLLKKSILPASSDGRSPGIMLWGHPENMVLFEGDKVRVHDDGPKAAALAVQAGQEHMAKRRPVDRNRTHKHWDDNAGFAA